MKAYLNIDAKLLKKAGLDEVDIEAVTADYPDFARIIGARPSFVVIPPETVAIIKRSMRSTAIRSAPAYFYGFMVGVLEGLESRSSKGAAYGFLKALRKAIGIFDSLLRPDFQSLFETYQRFFELGEIVSPGREKSRKREEESRKSQKAGRPIAKGKKPAYDDLIGPTEAARIFGFSCCKTFKKALPALPEIRTATRGKRRNTYYVMSDVFAARYPEMTKSALKKQISEYKIERTRSDKGRKSVPVA